jgi:N6-adenosine-specific RNA methylase IME4
LSDHRIDQATELAKYDAALRMLAEAEAVDEVLEIKNQAVAMATYARQAKNRAGEIKAMHIRFRAIRRLGEMILAQKATVGLAKGGTPYRDSTCTESEQVESRPPTLKEAGIEDRKLSSQAQRMAAIPLERFEELLKKHQAEAAGGAPRVSADLLRVDSEEEGRASRRDLAAELSRVSAQLSPTGQRYPLIYADPPWERKQGISSRSYENHYPTMSWQEICDLPVEQMALPDAWLALWIPRAHLLARHAIEIEQPLAATGEVVRVLVELPLADAIARSWGFERYSTCFVWTKTDEDHPDESGSGMIAFDQDELLLLFKRGQGLPKPAGSEKYGSNHRERSRPLGHSAKPQHYRKMLADMVGADRNGEPLPALELFARHDPARPLPKNWDVWGNQAEAPGASPGDVAIAAAAELEDVQESAADETEPTPVSSIDQVGGLSIEPAPPACPPEIGKVETQSIEAPAGPGAAPDPVAPVELPADRPGSLFEELDLPDFLRRDPSPAPAIAQAELDLARIDRSPPEIVDDHLQTRLPLTEDELELQAALRAIDTGKGAGVHWSVKRDLVGAGFLHVTVEREIITAEGEAFLAQLVAPARAVA